MAKGKHGNMGQDTFIRSVAYSFVLGSRFSALPSRQPLPAINRQGHASNVFGGSKV